MTASTRPRDGRPGAQRAPFTPASSTASAGPNGHGTVTPMPGQDALPGQYAVPGSPGYRYTPGEGVWRTGQGRPVRVFAWCPVVERRLAATGPHGEHTHQSVTLRVGDVVATVPMRDVLDREGSAWQAFPDAVGYTGRDMRGVLAGIVGDQAARLPLTPLRAGWSGDRLALPPADVIEQGYGETRGTRDDFVAFLRAVAVAPRVALVCGFAVAGLYVAPLRRQPAVVHLSGAGRQGKTTAEYAAAAVLGYPGDSPESPTGGLVKPWNTTGLGPNTHLGRLVILPGFRDELGAAGFTPGQLGKLVMGLTQGAERDMSTRTGEHRAASTSWHSYLVSTGNVGILDQLGGWDGIPSRVVEVVTPITPDPATADRIAEAARLGCGHGLAAVATLGPTPEAFGRMADQAAVSLGVAPGGIPRTIGRHLSMAVAGARTLARLFGVPELVPAAELAASEVLAELLAELVERGATPGDRLLAAIAGAMATSPARFPTRAEHDMAAGSAARDGRPLPEVWGWDLSTDAALTGDVAIAQSQLGPAIARPAGIEDAGIALRELRKRGHLTPSTDGRHLARLVKVRGVPVRVYLLSRVHPDDQDDQAAEVGPTVAEVVAAADPVELRQAAELVAAAELAEAVEVDSAELVDLVPALAASTECPVCAQRGPWCGPGREWVVTLPCAGCGRQVRTSARCGTVHCPDCDRRPSEGHQDGPTPAGVRAHQDGPNGRQRPAQRAGGANLADGTADLPTRDEELANLARILRRADQDAPEPAEAELAAALDAFHQATARGKLRPLSVMAGVGRTGQAQFKRLAKLSGQDARLEAYRSELVDRMSNGGNLRRALDYVHPDAAPTLGGHLVGVDVNAQYVTAAQSVELGTGEPVHHSAGIEMAALAGLRFPPGYVVLARKPRLKALQRKGFGVAFADLCAGEVLTVEHVKYLSSRGVELALAEAVIWPDHRRWLGNWAEHMLAARKALAGLTGPGVELARRVVKVVSAGYVAGYVRSDLNPTPTMRRDWSDMVRAAAEMNELRQLDRVRYGFDLTATDPVVAEAIRGGAKPTGPAATAVCLDTAWYSATDPGWAPAALDVTSGRPGKWKLTGSTPVTAELVEAYRTGSAYLVRAAIYAAEREEGRR